MPCPDCDGNDQECFRCDGSGSLCDHCGESAAYCVDEECQETDPDDGGDEE